MKGLRLRQRGRLQALRSSWCYSVCVMTCSKCQQAERIPGQRWCRGCLPAYARHWRTRRRLEKPSIVLREAKAQIEAMLQAVGGPLRRPQCCNGKHLFSVSAVCGCACHKARKWLEAQRVTFALYGIRDA
jgi:hypothetical protein